MSEKSALAPALLARRRPHVALAHNLTTPRRRQLQRVTRWLQRIDRVIVLCRCQERYLLEEAGLSPERVRFIFDKVDHRFFRPGRGGASEAGGYVLSVGQTQRDYGTLLAALAQVDTRAVIVASSLWTDSAPADIGSVPPQVEVRRDITPAALRGLYDGAAAVVVPLVPGLEFAAGVNAVLEAMAMAKPLVVSSTPGIADYVHHDRTGLLVPPADPRALSGALETLLSDGAAAGALGAAARSVVDSGRNMDTFVDAVAGAYREAAAGVG